MPPRSATVYDESYICHVAPCQPSPPESKRRTLYSDVPGSHAGLGAGVGSDVGAGDGGGVGVRLGDADGDDDGARLGDGVGTRLGTELGAAVGTRLGCALIVGAAEGTLSMSPPFRQK